MFGAVRVMQLVEQASITLDSKLAEFYPDLPNALEITYRDLLQHRSGLVSYTSAGFDGWRTTHTTHAELLKIIADGGAKFAPRARFEYSDSDYLLLGYILEKVYERSYDDLVRRHITDKLGLARTYYAGTGNANLESIAYQRTPGGWVNAPGKFSVIELKNGDMLSLPPHDLVRVMDALFTGKLVTAQSLESMRNQDGGSGMGLWPYEIAGQKGLGVTGDGEGFRACLYYFPERNLSIAYTSNAAVLPVDEIVKETLLTIFERGHRPTIPPVR